MTIDDDDNGDNFDDVIFAGKNASDVDLIRFSANLLRFALSNSKLCF